MYVYTRNTHTYVVVVGHHARAARPRRALHHAHAKRKVEASQQLCIYATPWPKPVSVQLCGRLCPRAYGAAVALQSQCRDASSRGGCLNHSFRCNHSFRRIKQTQVSFLHLLEGRKIGPNSYLLSYLPVRCAAALARDTARCTRLACPAPAVRLLG